MQTRISLRVWGLVLLAALQFCVPFFGQVHMGFSPEGGKAIPAGSKVYITPIEGGFEVFLAAGLTKKKVPLLIVNDRSKADFEITGVGESDKAGWAKVLFTGTDASREQASIKVVDLKTDVVVFAYSVNKGNSARGKQSAGEACAKHIGEKIEGR